jgi:hypothetical protein
MNIINILADKNDIGLGNVDNTSDVNKPVSTAQQTALNSKENLSNKSTDTALGSSDTLYPSQKATKTYVDNKVSTITVSDATTTTKGILKLAGDISGTADLPTVPGLASKENIITAGTTAQYFRGDKTFQTLNKSAVGLANVDNTSDANKPISTAQQTALNAKQNTLGFTPENVTNKENLTLDNSTTKYPTNNLVKTTLNNYLLSSLKGSPNGLAELDVAGKLLSSQLPSYVDDVLEYANLSLFPVTGESGKIYIAINTNISYRWSGSVYVEISSSLALGETSSTAYRGDRGKIAYDHSQTTGNPHGTNKNDVGLGNVDNTTDLNKPISTATQTELNNKENLITAGTTAQYFRGDKSFQTLDKNAVGLSNVDNTSDLNKPISTATQTALNSKFDNPTGSSIQYIDGTGSLQTFPTLSNASSLVLEVYNNTGATLTKGTVVYINGGQGNLPTVTKAKADSDATSAQTLGMIQTDLTNMNNGYVLITGKLQGLNTNAFAPGTQLYLSGSTAGTYTNIKPQAPIHMVYVGIVSMQHPTQGIIEVKVQNGYEMDELHDVKITTPQNFDALLWETSTQLWKNKKILNLTTIGYEGVATLSGNNLNIPAYKTMFFAGDFASGEGYNQGDIVRFNNDLYICILSIGSAADPNTDPTHWSLFISYGGGGSQTLEQTLALGNSAGAYNLNLNNKNINNISDISANNGPSIKMINLTNAANMLLMYNS